MAALVRLRDFNDGQFCSVMRFQRRSGLFLCFFYETAKTDGFVWLRDHNDNLFCSFMRFQ